MDDVVVDVEFAILQGVLQAFDDQLGALGVALGDGEGDVVEVIDHGALDDHVNADLFFSEGAEDFCCDTRTVFHAKDADFGNVFVTGDTGDGVFFFEFF